MKIEIDLNDILGDENGSETLQESVRRQVIDSVTATIKKGVGKQIDDAVASTISSGIKEYLAVEMPNLLANIMDAEYIPVERYGHRGEPTNFRKELVKSITENMVYKKANYESDKNSFTKAVDEVIAVNVKTFKEDFDKEVNKTFTASAMQYAVNALKQKLGITS